MAQILGLAMGDNEFKIRVFQRPPCDDSEETRT